MTTRCHLRGSLALLLSALLVLVASACGRSDTGPTPTSEPAFELFLTHKYIAWGYSMAYPAGWLPGLSQRTTFISETFEDHEIRKWPLLGPPRPVKGYQVTLSLPYAEQYYLSNNLRPEDWLVWQNMSGEYHRNTLVWSACKAVHGHRGVRPASQLPIWDIQRSRRSSSASELHQSRRLTSSCRHGIRCWRVSSPSLNSCNVCVWEHSPCHSEAPVHTRL